VIDYVGYVAGFLVTFAFLPQILRVYKLKSAREISLLFNTSTLLGAICWFIYGIVLGLVPIIVWNIIAILLTSLLMVYKLKYGRQ
jgi:MtN3 and saliva related transmembrane protein